MRKIKIQEICVIWINRKQTLKESTEVFLIFLEKLKTFDQRLSSWYLKEMTRKQGLKNKVLFEYEFIKNHFYQSKKYHEDDYNKFSFLIGFWNGGKTDLVSFEITASLGGESELGTNNCILTFPRDGELYEHYKIRKNWNKLLELFIDHWKPDRYFDFEGNLLDHRGNVIEVNEPTTENTDKTIVQSSTPLVQDLIDLYKDVSEEFDDEEKIEYLTSVINSMNDYLIEGEVDEKVQILFIEYSFQLLSESLIIQKKIKSLTENWRKDSYPVIELLQECYKILS